MKESGRTYQENKAHGHSGMRLDVLSRLENIYRVVKKATNVGKAQHMYEVWRNEMARLVQQIFVLR